MISTILSLNKYLISTKMKLQDNKGQYKLTIPKDLAKVKGWKQGTELAVVMNQEGDLVIKEIKKKR